MAQFNELWSRSPEHVRVAYSYEFFEACGQQLDEHLRDVRSNIDEVVDTMIEAITTVVPKPHYIPHAKTFWLFTLLNSLPDKVMDKLALKTLFPESVLPASCETPHNTWIVQ